VFKVEPSGAREPITDENSRDATWERRAEFLKRDPASRYDCGHSIEYRRGNDPSHVQDGQI